MFWRAHKIKTILICLSLLGVFSLDSYGEKEEKISVKEATKAKPFKGKRMSNRLCEGV
jgi:hypothetical protein